MFIMHTMQGIKFQIEKLLGQIDSMLLRPLNQPDREIYDINYYKFSGQALHLAFLLFQQCNQIEQTTRKMFGTLMRKIRQSNKKRPELQSEDEQHHGKQDQITSFLNCRSPFPENIERRDLEHVLHQLENKEKDTANFLQSFNYIKGHQLQKKKQNVGKEKSVQTEIMWVDNQPSVEESSTIIQRNFNVIVELNYKDQQKLLELQQKKEELLEKVPKQDKCRIEEKERKTKIQKIKKEEEDFDDEEKINSQKDSFKRKKSSKKVKKVADTKGKNEGSKEKLNSGRDEAQKYKKSTEDKIQTKRSKGNESAHENEKKNITERMNDLSNSELPSKREKEGKIKLNNGKKYDKKVSSNGVSVNKSTEVSESVKNRHMLNREQKKIANEGKLKRNQQMKIYKNNIQTENKQKLGISKRLTSDKFDDEGMIEKKDQIYQEKGKQNITHHGFILENSNQEINGKIMEEMNKEKQIYSRLSTDNIYLFEDEKIKEEKRKEFQNKVFGKPTKGKQNLPSIYKNVTNHTTINVREDEQQKNQHEIAILDMLGKDVITGEEVEKKEKVIIEELEKLKKGDGVSGVCNQKKIGVFIRLMQRMHGKLCGKDCKHLKKFYNYLKMTNLYTYRKALLMPITRIGFN